METFQLTSEYLNQQPGKEASSLLNKLEIYLSSNKKAHENWNLLLTRFDFSYYLALTADEEALSGVSEN